MSNRTWLTVCTLLGAFLAYENTGLAQTYRPRDDAVVLEILPKRANGYVPQELRALHVELARNPKNLDLALRLAEGFVAIGREQADPRAYGQAEAALKPWWTAAEPPVDVLRLRATIRQFNHEFAAALKDLDAYLLKRPDDVSARLMKAMIHVVIAEYDAARATCASLPSGREVILKATCSAAAAGLSGNAARTLEQLRAMATFLAPSEPHAAAWVEGTLGELSLRIGRTDDALAHFKAAQAAWPGDLFSLVSMADVLNDLGRHQEVLDLLADRTEQDSVLLRLTVAEKRLGLPAAKAHAAALAERFVAERERGSAPHLREEAYFRLYVTDEPALAAHLAHENWKVQREPIDARLLLEAAAKAREPRLAEPAMAWLAKTAALDPALVGAKKQLEAL